MKLDSNAQRAKGPYFYPIRHLGFSLIELMIVLTIMAALITLVGPLAINTVEKTNAKQEMLTMRNWFKKINYRAFSTGQSHILKLSGKKADLFILGQEQKPIISKTFDSLFFQPQVLIYSGKGFVSPLIVTGNYREQSFTLNLQQWVNNEDVKAITNSSVGAN